MIRQTAVAIGIGTAVLLGAAGTAFAAQSHPTATDAPAAASSGTAHHHRHGHRIFRGEYATWTTFDTKTEASTVHEGIKGTVSAVSPSGITVKAADGTSQTYAVGTGTTVHAKGDTKAGPGTIAQVKVGDRAVVLGTGQGTVTATRVLDRGVAPTTPAP